MRRQYSRDQAIAQSRIPKYRSARANEGYAMADTGMSYAGAGVDIGGGNQMVQLIELLLRSATRAGAVGVAGPCDLYR